MPRLFRTGVFSGFGGTVWALRRACRAAACNTGLSGRRCRFSRAGICPGRRGRRWILPCIAGICLIPRRGFSVSAGHALICIAAGLVIPRRIFRALACRVSSGRRALGRPGHGFTGPRSLRFCQSPAVERAFRPLRRRLTVQAVRFLWKRRGLGRLQDAHKSFPDRTELGGVPFQIGNLLPDLGQAFPLKGLRRGVRGLYLLGRPFRAGLLPVKSRL